MKKYLKMIGNVLLYLLIYFLLQGVFGLILGIAIVLIKGASSEKVIQNTALKYTYVAVAGAAVLSVIIYFLMFKDKEEGFIERCKFKKVKSKDILNVVLLGLSLGSMSISFIYLTQNIFTGYKQVSDNMSAGMDSILGIIAVIVLIPIFEEILFRGLVFNEFKKNVNLVVSIILQAAIFAIAHGNMAQAIYTFILGLMASLVYIWTKSIISNMLLHITFNLSGTFILPILIYYTEKYAAIYMVLGLILFAFTAVRLYRSSLKEIDVSNINIDI